MSVDKSVVTSFPDVESVVGAAFLERVWLAERRSEMLVYQGFLSLRQRALLVPFLKAWSV